MTCEETDTRLDDYVDGALPPAEAQAVAAHLGGCAACREDEAALRDVLQLAHDLPRDKQPARDLWPGIAARIQAPVAAAWPWRLAVAAALLVAASSALTYVLVRPTPQVAVDPSPAPAEDPATTAARPVSQGTDDATFVAATEELLDALDERRATLAPETRAVVDRNLAAIDAALGEIRAALRKDPGNVELERRLGSVHRRKIEVLQRVVRLSS
jgi:hypothetical protein